MFFRCLQSLVKFFKFTLYLTGVSPLNMRAQILVKEAGHAVHCKVAQNLKSKLIKL